MKLTVTKSIFIDHLNDFQATSYMTYEAKAALFEWYETLEEETGIETKLDAVAIGQDWTEYSEKEMITEYCYLIDTKEIDFIHNQIEDLIKELESETSVIKLANGNYLIMAF